MCFDSRPLFEKGASTPPPNSLLGEERNPEVVGSIPTEVKIIFPLPRVVPCFPLLGLTPNALFMGLSSTMIYTSEVILCSSICVPNSTPHNIHMYPYFLFAAIHHLKSSPTFSVRPCSSVSRVTVNLIRRSWVRFPPRSKDFFFTSCGSLFPFTRDNAQWVIHGFK